MILNKIQYVYKVFHTIYKKFLTAIDHIDYHPPQQHNRNTTRVKRSDMYTWYGQYHSQSKKLTPSEENFLDTFLKVLYKINPSLHNNLTRMKRTGIFTWFKDGEYSLMLEVSPKLKITCISSKIKTNCR